MDVLTSDGLTISNVSATYNSAFTNNLYPGIRFPSALYKDVTIENLTLTDTAAATVFVPVGNANNVENVGIVLSNVRVDMKKWARSTVKPYPVITGEGTEIGRAHV